MINPYPGLPEFDYIKPGSLSEASQFLVQHAGEARRSPRPYRMGGTIVDWTKRDN